MLGELLALAVGLVPDVVAWLKAVRAQDDEAAKLAYVRAARKAKRAAVKRAARLAKRGS